MKNTFNSQETKDGKKFLKTQLYTISDKIGKALSRYEEGEDKDTNMEDGSHRKVENTYIRDLLQEKANLFTKRAIVGDIWSYTKKIGGEERQIIQFKCKYGLGITVDNLNSFLDFCAIHGFIPMVDKIFIESNDVSKVKELYTLFAFAITKPSNPLIANSLANEIKKLEKTLQGPAKEVLYYLQQIVGYTISTYQYLLGEGLQKLKNIGTLSENIFAEIAIRIENQIRDRIGIESSYLKLAGYKDDMERKTDMDFIIKKTSNQSYKLIPLQFTTGSITGVGIKEKDIERYLIKGINEGSKEGSFIIFSVNGEFSKYITHGDRNDKLFLNKEYNEWINNPEEREKNAGSKFPLFIDSIDPKIIQPAEVMYIALHMLYKKYNFRYSEKDTYLNSFKTEGKIDKYNHAEINGVKLSDIFIEEGTILKIENPRPDYPGILKHKFKISYLGENMGIIVIYEISKKH